MSERLRHLGDEELGATLARLGEDIDYPATPDLAAAVADRLEREKARPSGRRWWAPGPQRRALAVAVLALAFVMAGSLVASPTLRRAVADALGVLGIRIEMVEQPPDVVLGAGLRLGQPVTLEEAQARVAFVLVPEVLGEPDEVYLATVDGVESVTFLYSSRAGLPESTHTGAGLLVTQFRGTFETDLAVKEIAPGTRLEPIDVDGRPGYWIEGDPHVIVYRDARGAIRQDLTRLAGNVLLFERGPITVRLEGALKVYTALRVADSLR